MKKRLACPVIFDGRNLYAPELMREFGFTVEHVVARARNLLGLETT